MTQTNPFTTYDRTGQQTPPPPVRRLHRSSTDRMVAGVCGGIAEYTGVDTTLVRLAVVLLSIFGGGGILLYLAAMLIIPDENGRSAISKR